MTPNGVAKVGDFGFVTDKLQFGFATPYGTPIYWAPEVYDNRTCSALSDVYSLGATFLNLVCGDNWFHRVGLGQIVINDQHGIPSLSPKRLFLPHIPKSWRTVINKLINSNITLRCSSMSSAVNLISKLPNVEPWQCLINDDVIEWCLHKGNRRVVVFWENYLRAGGVWTAWSEDINENSKRTLAKNDVSSSPTDNYRSLQDFFSGRKV